MVCRNTKQLRLLGIIVSSRVFFITLAEQREQQAAAAAVVQLGFKNYATSL